MSPPKTARMLMDSGAVSFENRARASVPAFAAVHGVSFYLSAANTCSMTLTSCCHSATMIVSTSRPCSLRT